MEKEQSVEPRLPQGELHRVLRLAAVAHGLPDAVLVTGHVLLRYIPGDADRPISPARVQDLADERGCDPRTIRSHIRRLEAYGLVVDRSAGGGRRMIQRRRGRIVVLQGIDFSPMLAAADRIEHAALEAEIELDERRRLAARVSELKRQLRGLVMVGGDMAPPAAAALDASPSRHRGLPLRELAALVGRLEAAIRVLADDDEDAGSRIFSSDRTDEIVRPNTTEKDENPVCRPQRSQSGAEADALRHITLDMLAVALPFDWRARIERSGGGVSWASLTAAAYERAAEIGVTDAIWAEAQAELGRAGAAVLVLLADASSIERRGAIRCPAAWVRAMAARAETEPLRLSRNLFGLLHQARGADDPCPTLVPSHPQTWRNPSCLVS
ncbi:DNA-binding MarR family transcriptional regulator [Amaricoccus macauensis]|uniref:DNA-binding MarR family transcriptional regulator n=1 Tax=Amaricoccus macauensis TaxID=57001 RepID=A0A840SZV5_9RHOB|nr:replication initiation protein RepC [Amaricoccus macauensis]MBB5224572.1 DNA-binding MarR family transcriptional regulator [Amaricoccus macauensis]